MQGLADGYFVLPYTIQNYLADQSIWPRLSTDMPEFDEAEKAVQTRIDRLFSIKGKRTVDSLHKKLGNIMWEYVGMARNEAGLKKAIEEIRKLKEYFYSNVRVTGSQYEFNQELRSNFQLRV